jgi:Spy/CpxP family protein refolding chaperone
MNDNRGTRVWQWAVVLLILCNAGLIVMLWMKPHPDGPSQGRAPRDLVVKELHMTNEQISKYDVLIKEHQQAMHRLKDAARDYRHQLFENLKGDPARNMATDSLASKIAANQKEIEMVTYRHFEAVRALCTDQQKQDFDRIIQEVTKMMNGGAGGRKHLPEDRPEGPPPPGEQPEGPPQGGH